MKRVAYLFMTVIFLLSCSVFNVYAECEYHEMGSWYYYDQYISEPEIRHTICFQVVKEFFKDCQNCAYFEVLQVVDNYEHEWLQMSAYEAVCVACGMWKVWVK